MVNPRTAMTGLLLIVLLKLVVPIEGALTQADASNAEVESEDVDHPVAQTTESAGVQVTLWAADRTISWDARASDRQEFELPLLYLHRQRTATPQFDRTLQISISGLTSGAAIQLEAVSHHEDVSTDEPHRVSTNFVAPGRFCTLDDPCTVQWTFDPAATPSDFYSLRVMDSAGEVLWRNPYSDRPDFVMLDTWDVGLGDYTVHVIYATLFPFARGEPYLGLRLAPDKVTDFIEQQFVPTIIGTWHTQVEAWGFGDPLHPGWDLDNVIEIIVTDGRFALFDGSGTRTLSYSDGRPYPQRRIWWLSTVNNFRFYYPLANGYRAVFAHEFFHLMQWNILLSTGNPAHRWQAVFVEAQGKFVPSVQVPELEIGKHPVVKKESEYTRAANRFLAHRLNASYRDLETDSVNRYDAALYWRFLYEQFNDMRFVRAALEEMAHHNDADIVRSIGSVMDAAFARVDGPIHSFEESLVAFARANYALRLENGRCAVEDPAGCGGRYYDPKRMYAIPPLEAELDYAGALLTYDGAIPSSFGMDFIEVSLEPGGQDHPLALRFQGAGPVARFNVQIWRLSSTPEKPRAMTPQPESVPQQADGAHIAVIPHVDTPAYDRLALIITRLDADEGTDQEGAYHITLESADGFSD